MADVHLHLHITGASEKWLDRFARLLAELPASATSTTTTEAVADTAGDTLWTASRALHLIEGVSDRALLLLRAAVEGGSRVDGDAFRKKHGTRALNGPSRSITAIFQACIKQGLLPEEISRPLTPSGPDAGGWSRTSAYYLAEGALPAFEEAFRIHDQRLGETTS